MTSFETLKRGEKKKKGDSVQKVLTSINQHVAKFVFPPAPQLLCSSLFIAMHTLPYSSGTQLNYVNHKSPSLILELQLLQSVTEEKSLFRPHLQPVIDERWL